MFHKYSQTRQRFSIRKQAIGAASVLIGFGFLMASTPVRADEATLVTNTEVLVTDSVGESDLGTEETVPLTDVTTVSLDEKPVSDATASLDMTETEVLEKSEPEKEIMKDLPPVTESTVSTVSVSDQTESDTKDSVLVDVEELDPELATTEKIEEVPEVTTERSAARGDDYPWRAANPNTQPYDTYGYNIRQCASFVAFRLRETNKLDFPRAYGDARAWGERARQEGYRVDMTPAIGAVAWYGPSAFGGDPRYGHVAWVSDVRGDDVEIEEYNYNYSLAYRKGVIKRHQVSGYIHFKDLVVASSSGSTSGAESTTTTNLPSSGVFRFTEMKGIKSEPKLSSPDIAYYNQGQTVNYDKTLKADGYEWISYLSYAGNRRYIPINKLSTVTKPQTSAQPILSGHISTRNQNNQAGTFEVVISNVSSPKGLVEVKVPTWSTKDGQDDIVWYKATKQSDGTYTVPVSIANHKYNRGEYNIHLYYMQNDGNLVGVGVATTTVEEASSIPNQSLPSSGQYIFKVRSGVKSSPSLSSPDLAYYEVGQTVNYDRVLTAEGRQWISYISFSGNRRYIAI